MVTGVALMAVSFTLLGVEVSPTASRPKSIGFSSTLMLGLTELTEEESHAASTLISTAEKRQMQEAFILASKSRHSRGTGGADPADMVGASGAVTQGPTFVIRGNRSQVWNGEISIL
jgi:hypothetical protein